MKQFIVLMAVLPMLLVFMAQVTADARSMAVIDRVQSVVYSAKEVAKQEGRFTDESVAKMRTALARAAGVDASEVNIETDETVKYRYGDTEDERLIYYRVEVPMKNVMAGASLFGLTDDENSYVYVIDSYTASERI